MLLSLLGTLARCFDARTTDQMEDRMKMPRSAVSVVVLAGLVLGSLALAPSAGAAVDCFVKNKSRGGTYSDLQEAIDDANSGNVLRVKGTCTGTFDIDKNLTIRGGSTNLATLDGNGEGTVVTVESTVHVVLGFLVITGGLAAEDGGGIHNSGTLRVKDSEISDNEAADQGGGVYNEDSETLKLRRVTVESNTGDLYGGGVFNDGGTATLRDVKLRGNQTPGDSVLVGPRIVHGASSPIGLGGALFNNGGTMNIKDSTIGKQGTENTAIDGGGLFADGTVNVDSSTFHYNTAEHFGGGIFVSTIGEVNLNDTDVTFNLAGPSPSGGGVFTECGGTLNQTGTTTIANNNPDQQATDC